MVKSLIKVCCRFTAESSSENYCKNFGNFGKLLARIKCLVFLTHGRNTSVNELSFSRGNKFILKVIR